MYKILFFLLLLCINLSVVFLPNSSVNNLELSESISAERDSIVKVFDNLEVRLEQEIRRLSQKERSEEIVDFQEVLKSEQVSLRLSNQSIKQNRWSNWTVLKSRVEAEHKRIIRKCDSITNVK